MEKRVVNLNDCSMKFGLQLLRSYKRGISDFVLNNDIAF